LQVLEEHFGRDVGAEDIEAASNLDPLVDNDEYASHGERVVSVVMERGELFSFIRRRWRRHFLDSLQPQYLSDKWSVGYDLHQ
jgi:hypothetical protein